jgi:hypothetical protein
MNLLISFNRPRKWALVGLGLLAVLLIVVPITLNLRLKTEQEVWLGTVASHLEFAQSRVSEANPLRRYRLPFDTVVTAETAGQAVHTVFAAGHPRNEERFREPTHLVERSWLPDTLPHQTSDNRYAGLEPSRLFREAVQGFDDGTRATLGQIATHPAFEEYSVAARAAQADLLSARFELPFPPDLDYWNLPVAYTGPIKDAAYAHVAKAALVAADGRFADAEHDVREVLSFGFLMTDEATNFIDTYAGMITIRVGYQALKELLVLTGQEAQAHSLPPLATQLELPSERSERLQESESSTFSQARSRLLSLVADSTITPGVRWQKMVEFAYLPCETVAQMITGPGRDYQLALSSVRRTLIRRESDTELLDLILQTPEREKIVGLSPCRDRS